MCANVCAAAKCPLLIVCNRFEWLIIHVKLYISQHNFSNVNRCHGVAQWLNAYWIGVCGINTNFTSHCQDEWDKYMSAYVFVRHALHREEEEKKRTSRKWKILKPLRLRPKCVYNDFCMDFLFNWSFIPCSLSRTHIICDKIIAPYLNHLDAYTHIDNNNNNKNRRQARLYWDPAGINVWFMIFRVDWKSI